ncbi:MAG: class I SAM-dependent methyltransferase [Proteobacteria bacterium]|nr:class I SAM-dependent methyltransferase [Pseudomonadota bacterium]
MNGHDPRTLAFYAREASDYVARFVDGINCNLPDFLDRLVPGASILELGCGAGRDAAYMIERGFAVEPSDGVPAMAALAEARLGRAVRVLRFEELDADGVYDAVYASYSLLHVPRAGLDDVLARIWRALKPGGWHMATYKSGGSEGRDSLGRYFNYLSREQAQAFYAHTGAWDRLEFSEGIGGGYDNRPSSWVNVIARKVV